MPRGMSAFVQQANTAQGFVTNRLETRNFFGDAPLLRASAAFRYAPLFCSFADVVRARITKAAIACQNIAPAVAVFERVILAIPIHATCASLDHRAPWGLISPSRWTKKHTSKSGDSSKDQARHRDLQARCW